MTGDWIHAALKSSLERADAELAGVKLHGLTEEQNLFGGKGSALDSLSLVSFIFILEEEFFRVTGKKIKISTQDILSGEEAPFRNLKTLENWLTRKASDIGGKFQE